MSFTAAGSPRRSSGRTRLSLIATSRVAVAARMVATRREPLNIAISPKNSPAGSCAVTRPLRITSTRPDTMTYSLSAAWSCSKTSSPGPASSTSASAAITATSSSPSPARAGHARSHPGRTCGVSGMFMVTSPSSFGAAGTTGDTSSGPGGPG